MRRKASRAPRFTPWIVVALAAASPAGCGAPEHAAVEDGRAPVAVSVLVVRPAGGGNDLVLPGRVEAREEVTISSRIAGRVTALPVSAGAPFRAGDVLVRFDAPEAREALAAADAQWTAARARLGLARRQEARFESLYAAKVAALHELEVVRSERESAEAAERAASASAAGRRAGVEIRAPFAGVVVRRRADPGADVGPGAPLLDLRSRESGLVATAVPERDADRARGEASIQIAEGPWQRAALVRMDGMIDPVSRTRMARFRPRDGAAPLEPGAFARVRLGAARPERSKPGVPAAGAADRAADPVRAYDVPASAIVRRGALAGVYVLREGRASLRWLRVGRQEGDRVIVLAGLDSGDTVALDPTGLEDGRRAVAAP